MEYLIFSFETTRDILYIYHMRTSVASGFRQWRENITTQTRDPMLSVVSCKLLSLTCFFDMFNSGGEDKRVWNVKVMKFYVVKWFGKVLSGALCFWPTITWYEFYRWLAYFCHSEQRAWLQFLFGFRPDIDENEEYSWHFFRKTSERYFYRDLMN